MEPHVKVSLIDSVVRKEIFSYTTNVVPRQGEFVYINQHEDQVIYQVQTVYHYPGFHGRAEVIVAWVAGLRDNPKPVFYEEY